MKKIKVSAELAPRILIDQGTDFQYDAQSLRQSLVELRDFIRHLGSFCYDPTITVAYYENSFTVLDFLINSVKMTDVPSE